MNTPNVNLLVDFPSVEIGIHIPCTPLLHKPISCVCVWPPLAAVVARCVTDCALRDVPRCRQGTNINYCDDVIQLAFQPSPPKPFLRASYSYCTTHINDVGTMNSQKRIDDDSMWSGKLLVAVRYASNKNHTGVVDDDSIVDRLCVGGQQPMTGTHIHNHACFLPSFSSIHHSSSTTFFGSNSKKKKLPWHNGITTPRTVGLIITAIDR